jgi:hypothetical protein
MGLNLKQKFQIRIIMQNGLHLYDILYDITIVTEVRAALRSWLV